MTAIPLANTVPPLRKNKFRKATDDVPFYTYKQSGQNTVYISTTFLILALNPQINLYQRW